MDWNAEIDGHIEDMPLVAAGGFADDEYRSRSLLPIALHLGLEQPTHGLGLIGNRALLIGRQCVHHDHVF